MNLWLATFDLDNTQFLVDADTETEAIQDAIAANTDCELLGKIDDDELPLDEIKRKENYSIESISFKDLGWMFRNRTDCLGHSNIMNNVIVFAG